MTRLNFQLQQHSQVTSVEPLPPLYHWNRLRPRGAANDYNSKSKGCCSTLSSPPPPLHTRLHHLTSYTLQSSERPEHCMRVQLYRTSRITSYMVQYNYEGSCIQILRVTTVTTAYIYPVRAWLCDRAWYLDIYYLSHFQTLIPTGHHFSSNLMPSSTA